MQSIENAVRNRVFNYVHGNNLVYNICWEDPRCDRQLLQLEKDSKVIMITSAGCNALEYLLDNPASIDCIDLNFRQNAVLELKQALFKNGSFETLWSFFGEGKNPNAVVEFQNGLKNYLSADALKYWNKNIESAFGKKLFHDSYYHYGTSGTFAWLITRALKKRKSLAEKVQKVFNAKDLEVQAQAYKEVEEEFITARMTKVLNHHFTMCLVGVPRSQQELFREKYINGATGYIQECLTKVFTQLPASENHFYKVYLDGKYSKDCCPAYLKEKNFYTMSERVDNIKTHTTSISDFLKANPGKYSHYILLDHQDWLAANDIPALDEEWKLILENSKPGTRILLRSAAQEVDFFPDFVKEAVTFEQELTAKTHAEDRVGTYGSVYLAIVK